MTQEYVNDQVRDARETGVQVSALEHPMVLAALARMASSGAWQRIIEERPLSEDIDVADAEFLVAAGAVVRLEDDTFRLALSDSMYRDPEAVANSGLFMLRRSLSHASGQALGWANEDTGTIVAFGRVTGHGGDVITDELLPRLPAVEAAFSRDARLFSMLVLASRRSRSGLLSEIQGRVPSGSTCYPGSSNLLKPKSLGSDSRTASNCGCSRSRNLTIRTATTWRGFRKASFLEMRSWTAFRTSSVH